MMRAQEPNETSFPLYVRNAPAVVSTRRSSSVESFRRAERKEHVTGEIFSRLLSWHFEGDYLVSNWGI